MRIDRVERPADDRLVHVYLTLRNDGPRRLLQTQDVSVVHRDSMGISAESSQSLKPQTGRPELFGAPQPVALPGRELRAKYVFDRNGATTGITVREGADYSAEFGF